MNQGRGRLVNGESQLGTNLGILLHSRLPHLRIMYYTFPASRKGGLWMSPQRKDKCFQVRGMLMTPRWSYSVWKDGNITFCSINVHSCYVLIQNKILKWGRGLRRGLHGCRARFASMKTWVGLPRTYIKVRQAYQPHAGGTETGASHWPPVRPEPRSPESERNPASNNNDNM